MSTNYETYSPAEYEHCDLTHNPELFMYSNSSESL